MNQWPAWLPLRQNLRELSPYGAPQLPADAVMNTNENPYAPSPALAKAIADRVSEVALSLNRYPDRDAVVLRTKLAEFINGLSGTDFNSKNLWAANGSNEIIQSLFMAFGGGTALGFTPSYSMHGSMEVAAKISASISTLQSRRFSAISQRLHLSPHQTTQQALQSPLMKSRRSQDLLQAYWLSMKHMPNFLRKNQR